MVIITKFFKYENANTIEVTWAEIKEEFIKIDVIEDKEVETVDTKTVETTIHCQAFPDNQIDLLRQTASKFETILTIEHEEIIADVIKNIVVPTQEELEAIEAEKEKQRILSIKAEAGRIIESRYSIIWQLNHTRMDIAYVSEYAWIDSIRAISNEAEINGSALEYIDWGI